MMLHLPFPITGELPSSKALPFGRNWSGPALALVGLLQMRVTVSVFTHDPFDTDHINLFTPFTNPETFVL